MSFRRFLIITLVVMIYVTALNASVVNAEIHDSGSCIKCGTMSNIDNYLHGVHKPAARRDRHTSTLSSEGHVRAHYDTIGFHAPDMTDIDLNGISDYVDSTLVYLEYAYDIQVNQLGYNPPLPDNGDGGGDEIDVYITDYGSQKLYGEAVPTFTSNGYSAYLIIDNGFTESQYGTKGYDGLRVTTAHEFFHVVQFSYFYDIDFFSWWMEQTAVWMEERIWDDINDYLNYLEYFFNDRVTNKTSIDSNSNPFYYGAGIWPIYLARSYGDDIIRELWEALEGTEARSVSVFDDVLPEGLGTAVNEFAVWNYFTSTRANTVDFYPDSDKFGYGVFMDNRENFSPASRTKQLNHLASRYAEILFVGNFGEHDALHIKVTPEGAGEFDTSIVFYNDPDDYEIHKVARDGSDIPLSGEWEKAVLVTSCTKMSGNDYAYTYETEIMIGTDVDENKPDTFALHDVYPNPFNPATTISFNLPEPGHVRVRVFNTSGQVAGEVLDSELSAGEKKVLWRPEGLAGGLYFVTIETPSVSKTTKALYLK